MSTHRILAAYSSETKSRSIWDDVAGKLCYIKKWDGWDARVVVPDLDDAEYWIYEERLVELDRIK